ncbi:MAG: hypothetical protein II421_01045 [Bacteroidales bacterium]|jgi:hypothetical protein|nr:hypothetical protein [Bacteroidales bacterium]MBQ2330971.1 hypothetical protein [Bacteroidales bacterium]
MNIKSYQSPACDPLAADLEWNLLADASGYGVDDGTGIFNAPREWTNPEEDTL